MEKSLYIALGDGPPPLAPQEWLDMTFDPALVGRDGGWLLDRAPLGEIEVAQLGNARVALGFVPGLRRVAPGGLLPQEPDRFLPGLLGRSGRTMPANRDPAL